MAAETQYTMNTGYQTWNTANSNLDGTGFLANILAATANGTLIKTVTIKATGSTTQGMVRLFIYDGTNTKLLQEIEVPAVTQSSTDPAFETTVNLNFLLKSGWNLKASTEKAETFCVIAEGLNVAYYATSVRADTTKYTPYNGSTSIATANSNLDGTGTMGIPLQSGGTKGTILLSVAIKAIQNTTDGMIRLFLSDQTTVKIFKEIPVRAVTKSATAKAFEHVVRFPDGFGLKNGWQLRVSTQNAETFRIVCESLDLSYPA